tara:strand:- start:300 stop:833 length:534 start_codon:yes stop_codon:yes gene_type:complete
MIVCGLDISTSCIGICVKDTESDKTFFYYFKPRGANWMEKAINVKAYLHKLFIDHEIDKVYVEENLQAFRRGLSSAKTLMALARFNGVVSFMIKDIFGIEPEFLNVNAARKSLDIKIDRKSSKNTKEQILEWVDSEINYEWPTKKLKSGPRKGQVVLEDFVYDMADAYVIARAGLVQ